MSFLLTMLLCLLEQPLYTVSYKHHFNARAMTKSNEQLVAHVSERHAALGSCTLQAMLVYMHV